jgi:hypothetical protein
MGKSHRICNVCNESYFGQGKYCCSIECRNIYLTGKKQCISDSERKRRSESMTLKTKNKKLSQEHKDKIGKAVVLRWQDEEYREKNCKSREGRIVSDETKNKIRIGNLGIKKPGVSEYNKNRIPPHDWHHTEASKQTIREKVSGDKNGQYGKLPPKVKPITFIDVKGRMFIFRSKWEEKFAQYLDKCHVDWDYEKTTYKLSDGSTYTPDFFTDDCIFEVKGFTYKRSMEKFECFKKDHPDLNIVLANRFYLTRELLIKIIK